MDNKTKAIEQAETRAELLDLESLKIIKDQQQNLQNIQQRMKNVQVELDAYKFENLKGEQRIQAIEKALTTQIEKAMNFEALYKQADNNLKIATTAQNYLTQENQNLKQLTANLTQEKDEIQRQLLQNTLNNQFYIDQLNDIKNRNTQLIRTLQLQENTISEKQQDLIKLAQQCKQLMGDNKQMAQKVVQSNREVGAILQSAKEVMTQHIKQEKLLNLKNKNKEFLSKQLEKCLDQHLIMKRALKLENRAFTKLKALGKALRFVNLLKQEVKNPSLNAELQLNIKDVNKLDQMRVADLVAVQGQEQPITMLLDGLGIQTQRKAKATRAAYPRDLQEDLKLLMKNDPTGLLSGLVKKMLDNNKLGEKAGTQLENLEHKNEMLQKQVESMNQQQNKYIAQVANLTSCNELAQKQLDTANKELEAALIESNEKAQALIAQEQEIKQIKFELQTQNKQLTEDLNQKNARLEAVTNALEMKSREFSRLERDFSRANARVRAGRVEVETARRIFDGIQGQGMQGVQQQVVQQGQSMQGSSNDVIAEKRRRLKELEMQMNGVQYHPAEGGWQGV